VVAQAPGQVRVASAVAVAFGQHPAPRGLVDDLSQARDTSHGLFQFEMEKATKLVL
jgi:hypothetical protein